MSVDELTDVVPARDPDGRQRARTSSPSSSAAGSSGWSATRSGTGEEPAFDELQFIKYGTEDAVERALQLGEIDMVLEVAAGDLRAPRRAARHRDAARASPSYTQLAFNLCSEENCPDAEFNPAVQDMTVRQAIAYALDRERINEISALGTSFVANGILPVVLQVVLRGAGADLPLRTSSSPTRCSTTRAGCMSDDGAATKDGEALSFDLYVRSESQSDIQAAKLIAEKAPRSESSSTSRWSASTS